MNEPIVDQDDVSRFHTDEYFIRVWLGPTVCVDCYGLDVTAWYDSQRAVFIGQVLEIPYCIDRSRGLIMSAWQVRVSVAVKTGSNLQPAPEVTQTMYLRCVNIRWRTTARTEIPPPTPCCSCSEGNAARVKLSICANGPTIVSSASRMRGFAHAGHICSLRIGTSHHDRPHTVNTWNVSISCMVRMEQEGRLIVSHGALSSTLSNQ